MFNTTGKEATIFNAHKEIISSGITALKRYIAKVYKIKQPISHWIYDHKTDTYKHTVRYPRSTKLAHLKARKEMLYYQRMKNARIPCPEVIAFDDHVIVLSVIGETEPATSLLCAQIKELEKRIQVYKQVVKCMKTLYIECNLIHGDLSGENILWYNDTCYFIDLGQSVESHEEQAFHLLFNDCRNISNVSLFFFRQIIDVSFKWNIIFQYFNMVGVPKVLSAEDLFLDITGYNYLNRFSLAELQEIEMKQYEYKQNNAVT